ncbi:MAG: sugar phosphate isomerase/epimerase [Bacteroidales bacterium]|nr:sugar phosphate isomerase/epimerase [Bacteroidales bacterium]
MKAKIIISLLILITSFSGEVYSKSNSKDNSEKEIGIQLYSIRSILDKYLDQKENTDLAVVLKRIANMGYSEIEAANYDNGKFYNRRPKEFKNSVERAGMKVLSSHCSKALSEQELSSGDFSESLKWWDQCIKAHKDAGMKYIVTPWMAAPKTLKELQTYCDYYNEIGKKCKEVGILYGYHNHNHEFEKIEDKEVMLDYMLEHTNPDYVFFEMDVYWTVMGKSNPVDYFNKYPGRFTLLHIKDEKEIGKSGLMDFESIFNNMDKAGCKHIIVEVENYSYDVGQSLQVSIDYLKNASYVKTSYNK